MFPELFKIPGTSFSIHSFGLMMVLGAMIGMQVAKRLARARGLDGEQFINMGIIALLTGLVGARLSHVLENFSYYTDPAKSVFQNLKAAANITSGGLTYYGGFLLAAPCVSYFIVRKRLPFRTTMDIVAPVLMIGLAFGRIGCFLNGCCYGAEADLPWAVRFPYGSIAYVDQLNNREISLPRELQNVSTEGITYPMPAELAFKNPLTRAAAIQATSKSLHPAQLYSSFAAFMLVGICIAYFFIPHIAGRGLALMMMLEGTARFLLESVRAEPSVFRFTLAGHEYGLSYSMVLGMAIVGAGMLLWTVLGRLPKSEGAAAMPSLAATAQ